MNPKNKKEKSGQLYSILFVLALAGMILPSACKQNHTPKPHAYFRIDFPEKEYQLYEGDCPFSFDYPVYGTITRNKSLAAKPCWLDVEFPKYKGAVHLTYIEIKNGNFDTLINDSWDIIYKKIAMKADDVEPSPYINPEDNVFGMFFDITGNAASPVQFFVTDSVRNFLRGSLYFAVRPNQDSLAPVVNFFRKDVVRLMESVRWKNVK
jgi:gliding motility-associated lipoprotein GldD